MRFTTVFSASLIAPLVAAHGGIEGAPKIFGLPRELRASNPFAGHQARHVGRQFEARQGGNTEGRCGTQGGGASCAAGFCCSPEVSAHCGVSVILSAYLIHRGIAAIRRITVKLLTARSITVLVAMPIRLPLVQAPVTMLVHNSVISSTEVWVSDLA